MAGNNLSPRQKMIGMMYLVLTALLALNVSKQVLEAFTKINNGITMTTSNFNSKNQEVYSEFNEAYFNNPVKTEQYYKKANVVKSKSDSIVDFIQSLKFNLIMETDGGVKLEGENLDSDRNPQPLKNLLYSDLSPTQKTKKIIEVKRKKDKQASGEFLVKNQNGQDLQNSLESFKSYAISLVDDKPLVNSISEILNFDDVKVNVGSREKYKSWLYANFDDMPLVAAVALLSKVQADVRNVESDLINYLKKEIDAGSLKFTSAEAIQIAPSNYVFVGDSFKADIFLAAKDSTQNPVIYVGDYELDEEGFYKMIGSYDSIPVVAGKGKFSVKTRKQGYQNWGGLITMKTDEGTKIYPFNGEYQVAAQSFVVSPTKMNLLYILGGEMGNPIDVSVPGVSKDKIRVSCTNGEIKKIGDSWLAFPKKPGKANITVSAEIQGKNRTMGTMEFRVKRAPEPTPKINFAKNGKVKQNLLVSKDCKVLAKLENFEFNIKNTVVGFSVEGVYKGRRVVKQTLGNKLSNEMIEFVKDLPRGSVLTFFKIASKDPSGKKSILSPIRIEII
jgi:gliding motility-associated protein GldM